MALADIEERTIQTIQSVVNVQKFHAGHYVVVLPAGTSCFISIDGSDYFQYFGDVLPMFKISCKQNFKINDNASGVSVQEVHAPVLPFNVGSEAPLTTLSTFTPVLVGTTIAGDFTRTGTVGWYSVVGRMCYIWGTVTIFNTIVTAPTGVARVTGLPLTASNDTSWQRWHNKIPVIHEYFDSDDNWDELDFMVQPNQTYMDLYASRNTTASSLPDSMTWGTEINPANGLELHFNGKYLVAGA